MSQKTAVAYLRVSGRGQVDGDGFPRQRTSIDQFAHSQGIEVVAEYCDEGVSGSRELDDRRGLQEVIARVRSNGVRMVLVENATRLARDLMVSEVILREFRELGVSVIAADSGTDLTVGDDDPTRKLIRQVLGAVAEFERSVLVAKLRAARVRLRKSTGRCEGRKPYGDRPGESAIVDRIVALRRKPRRREPASYARIAATLNAEGVPSRTGKRWSPETVRQVTLRARRAKAHRHAPLG